MSGPLLDRATIERLFEELADELRFARARVQLYVIGGAAMSMSFDRDRTTQDVDARIEAGHGKLVQAVRKIARKRGLSDNWLNEQATAWMPREADRAARVLYNSPYLTITGASPKHLLAMKLDAGRPQDIEDAKVLMKRLGISDPAEAAGIHARLYPGERMKAHAVEGLARISRELTREAGGLEETPRDPGR